MGVDVAKAKDGKRLVGHSGGYPGFIGRTWSRIDDGITVSVLANAYDTAPGIVANSMFLIKTVESLKRGSLTITAYMKLLIQKKD